MINLYGDTKYICFDADSVTANNFMINFISENGLNNISTPSYSHRNGDNDYKNHYYFKLLNLKNIFSSILSCKNT